MSKSAGVLPEGTKNSSATLIVPVLKAKEALNSEPDVETEKLEMVGPNAKDHKLKAASGNEKKSDLVEKKDEHKTKSTENKRQHPKSAEKNKPKHVLKNESPMPVLI